MLLILEFLVSDYTFQEGIALADEWGVPYIECSANTGENVARVFHTLMREIEKDDGLLAEKNDTGCIVS